MPTRNLILLSIDDLRAVEHWGHFAPLVVTPNMDRLRDAGTSFERAVSQSPVCNPSRSSVLTGLQPSETGVLDNEMLWHERIDPATTLPAVLRDAGTYVAMFGKHFHSEPIPADYRALMFDEFSEPAGTVDPAKVIRDGLRQQGSMPSGRYGGPVSDLADEATVANAIDFLSRADGLGQPFFLGVGITKPHLDWYVPPEYFALYDQTDIRAALEQSLADGTIIPGDGEYFDVPSMSKPSGDHAAIAQNLDRWVDLIHGYLASTSYADAKIGQVLDALAANPALADETALLLWSDHGYHLGDKDRWGKFTQWREATEVPLILVDPDAPGGQSAQQVVSLTDIFPTVLDMLGLDVPPELGLRGHSLRPIAENVDVDWFDPATGKGVALTTIYGTVSIRVAIPGEGDFRYTIYPDGDRELYDLTSDPGEHVNRLDRDTGVGLTARDDQLHATLDAMLDDEMAASGTYVTDGRDTAGSAADELFISSLAPRRATIAGGDGDDTYVLFRDAVISEGAGGGLDAVVLRSLAIEQRFVIPANVEIVVVQNSATGNAADNILVAGGRGGTLSGGAGDDVIRGGPGAVFAMSGGAGDDYILSQGGGDSLNGGQGRDQLLGMGGNDTLLGGGQRDTLDGGAGNDTLTGNSGADSLTGGAGADVFDFDLVSESPPDAADVILDFEGAGAAAGDVIDVSGIDANIPVAGAQAFVWGGTGTGRLRAVEADGATVILGNVDADADPELRIVLRDGATLASAYAASDFVL